MAIFLSSITLGLIAQMLTLFIQSSKQTILNNQANIVGMLTVETIETQLRNFGPTRVSSCIGQENCVLFEQQYNQYVDESGIQVEYFDPANYLEISYSTDEITLSRETGTPTTIDLKGFVLSELSSIIFVGTSGEPIDGEYATIIFEIVLYAPSEDKTFNYTASYSFVIDIV
jgi:predicted membrane protein